MRFVKRISERGNVTLPNDLREALEIDEGDLVEFEVLGVLKKGRHAGPMKGRAPSSSAPAPSKPDAGRSPE